MTCETMCYGAIIIAIPIIIIIWLSGAMPTNESKTIDEAFLGKKDDIDKCQK